ncbi:hypothetical protein [Thiohalorhabdus methylotrophus]|uniref:Uncharacterized protein n=1 Tax=Thiohalorhabdus methylotrophus TaxID=3242694 RepID=A0ABV4TSC2_9GAMM
MSEERNESAENLAALRQELAAQRAVLASLATHLILTADNKHSMLEQVFTEALDNVERSVPHTDTDREAILDKVHELADLVQHGE